MENCAYGDGLVVDGVVGGFGCYYWDTGYGEEEASEDVVVGEVVAVLAGVCDGFGYEWGVGNCDSG